VTIALMTIRPGGADDLDTLLDMLDEAVRWMVARGQVEQWGSEPWSERPERRARAQGLAGGGGLRIAELDGRPVGALVVGRAPDYVPPAAGSELYVELLVTSRVHAGQGIGAALLRHAVAQARAAGCDELRVDCWAGAPPLVAYYEDQGFTRSGRFEVYGKTCQLFTMPLR
jgi:GNAT superfamily N-acetyltransferase